MDRALLRLELIKAAAAHPTPHAQGFAAGVLETAMRWEAYVEGAEKISGSQAPLTSTLGLPKKRA